MEISVLMSVYNGEKYLKEAIESILQQTFTDYEFLVMDDGSNDGSREILEAYSLKDTRIKVFSQNNAGLAESLNTLISYAKGKYLARMDADDMSRPQRFAKQVEYLENHKDIGVLATALYEIAPNTLPFAIRLLPEDSNEISDQLSKGINPIGHGSVMIRRKVLNQLGLVPYRTRISQDLDLWVRLCEITKIGIVNIPLYELRRTGDSVTKQSTPISSQVINAIIENKLAAKDEIAKINNDIKTTLDREVHKDIRSCVDDYLNGKGFFRSKQYTKAIIHFIQALRCPGTRKKALMFISLCVMGNLGWILHLKFNPNAYSGFQNLTKSD